MVFGERVARSVVASIVGAILASQYCASQMTGCNQSDIQLVDGSNAFEGRVEVCVGGQWGTVCSLFLPGWGPREAEVACRQSGKLTDSPPVALQSSYFGRGTGPILTNGAQCNGSELKLTDCQLNSLIGICDHGHDVGVICHVPDPSCGTGDVRLMDGNVTSLLAGRVEVCFAGVWGTVCNDSWDQRDARVVCRQLGSTSQYAFAVTTLGFGAGTGPILYNKVDCVGSELNLTECRHSGVNVHNCFHSKDAAVICSVAIPECNDTDVRLVDSESPTEGVVEICFGGKWGSVCNNEWNDSDAAVVCGQLGFSRQGAQTVPFAGLIFGEGSTPYMIDRVNCSGSEEILAECSHLGVNVHNCGWSQEAGVRCALLPSPSSRSTTPATVTTPTGGSDVTGPVVSGVLLGVLVVTIVIVVVICLRLRWYRKKYLEGSQTYGSPAALDLDGRRYSEMYLRMTPRLSVVTQNSSNEESYTQWKKILGPLTVEASHIELYESIGQGFFGDVYKGRLSDTSDQNIMEVAVKTLKGIATQADIDSFMAECATMVNFDHPNVVKLIGVCFDATDQLPFIILPFMANKDLKSFLVAKREQSQNLKEDQFPKGTSLLILMRMCLDVAQGMEYLSSKKFVHRDLAARNCMVDDKLTIKVADFGLSRDVHYSDYYRLTHKVPLPVKWMAPECLHDNVFSEKSDVWAFGIVCWEVFKFGRNPYPGIDNAEISDFIGANHRLKRPSLCPQNMYETMFLCWLESPAERPTFTTLVKCLCEMIKRLQDQTPYYNLPDGTVPSLTNDTSV